MPRFLFGIQLPEETATLGAGGSPGTMFLAVVQRALTLTHLFLRRHRPANAGFMSRQSYEGSRAHDGTMRGASVARRELMVHPSRMQGCLQQLRE